MHVEVGREYHITLTPEGDLPPIRVNMSYEECLMLRDSLNAILGESAVVSRQGTVGSRQSAVDSDSDEEERPWTQPEESVLWELVNIGRPVPVIAEQLGRSRREIAWRIKQAGGEV